MHTATCFRRFLMPAPMRAFGTHTALSVARLEARLMTRWAAAGAALAAALTALPAQAWATTAGGGGMPWSTAIGRLTTSLQTEIAFLIVVVAAIAAGGYFVMTGELGVMGQRIGAVLITIGVVGGIVALATMAGMTGAVI